MALAAVREEGTVAELSSRFGFPVRTLVQAAALARPAIKVEIEAIAHIGARKG